jgi:PTH1 family peptidyl-tRNA hydrolase
MAMKLVVGLGNPGTQYAGTRHNAGFDVIAELVRRFRQAKHRRNFIGSS